MLATALTQTTQQSCEPQAAAARCMMARRGSRVDHLDDKALPCQESTEQGRPLHLAESGAKTLSADRIFRPTRRRRTKTTWQAWSGLSTRSAGDPCSRARDDTKNGRSGICKCDSENVDTFKQVKSHSAWKRQRSPVEASQVNETCKLELQPACMAVTAKFKPRCIRPGQVNLSFKMQ